LPAAGITVVPPVAVSAPVPMLRAALGAEGNSDVRTMLEGAIARLEAGG